MKPLNYEIFFLYPSFKLIVSFEGTKENEMSEFFFSTNTSSIHETFRLLLNPGETKSRE